MFSFRQRTPLKAAAALAEWLNALHWREIKRKKIASAWIKKNVPRFSENQTCLFWAGFEPLTHRALRG